VRTINIDITYELRFDCNGTEVLGTLSVCMTMQASTVEVHIVMQAGMNFCIECHSTCLLYLSCWWLYMNVILFNKSINQSAKLKS